jgi:hypothetical protein
MDEAYQKQHNQDVNVRKRKLNQFMDAFEEYTSIVPNKRALNKLLVRDIPVTDAEAAVTPRLQQAVTAAAYTGLQDIVYDGAHGRWIEIGLCHMVKPLISTMLQKVRELTHSFHYEQVSQLLLPCALRREVLSYLNLTPLQAEAAVLDCMCYRLLVCRRWAAFALLHYMMQLCTVPTRATAVVNPSRRVQHRRFWLGEKSQKLFHKFQIIIVLVHFAGDHRCRGVCLHLRGFCTYSELCARVWAHPVWDCKALQHIRQQSTKVLSDMNGSSIRQFARNCPDYLITCPARLHLCITESDSVVLPCITYTMLCADDLQPTVHSQLLHHWTLDQASSFVTAALHDAYTSTVFVAISSRHCWWSSCSETMAFSDWLRQAHILCRFAPHLSTQCRVRVFCVKKVSLQGLCSECRASSTALKCIERIEAGSVHVVGDCVHLSCPQLCSSAKSVTPGLSAVHTPDAPALHAAQQV